MSNRETASLPTGVKNNGSAAATADTEALAVSRPKGLKSSAEMSERREEKKEAAETRAEDRQERQLLAQKAGDPVDYFFYVTEDDSYYYWHDDHWGPIDKTTAYENLQFFFGRTDDKETGPHASQFLAGIRKDKKVRMALKIAGYKSGRNLDNRGKPFLVVESTQPLKAVKGEWGLIRKILTGMLGEEQLPYFYAWLKHGRSTLHRNSRDPGHYLIIMGPNDCGKTLTQERIIDPLFDAVGAKCLPYLTGETPFNADLYSQFHWKISDGLVLQGFMDQKTFTEKVKEAIANTLHWIHGKGRNGINIPFACRITCSLNPDSIDSLPLLTEDAKMADKVLLFKGYSHPYVAGNPECGKDRDEYQDNIARELPAFAYFIDHEVVLPTTDSFDKRFGFTGYLNPEIMEAREEESKELSLASILRQELGEGFVSTTVGELFERLTRGDSKVIRQANGLFKTVKILGTLLGHLAKAKDNGGVRVVKRKSNGVKVVEIDVAKKVRNGVIEELKTKLMGASS
jgi:hypothetical protein